jgi:hypothetical protein
MDINEIDKQIKPIKLKPSVTQKIWNINCCIRS